MRFRLLILVVIIQVLNGSGIATKLEKRGEDWNSRIWAAEYDPNIQSRSYKYENEFYESYGYDLVRDKRVVGTDQIKPPSFSINAVPEMIYADPEIAGVPEVDGVPEMNANPDCAARVCDVAQCECVDNWDMFSQTCNLLEKKFCTENVLKVIEKDGVYQTFYEALTNFNGQSITTIHVITTESPIFDQNVNYGTYDLVGKMRTYTLDGKPYCLDEYLNEGIDKDDCWYDVRIMGHQPLCEKKRNFFQVDNHADVLIQLRYQSDLDRGGPSMIKPPFACARLCNPNIETSTLRGFIAPSPGKELQKCVPKEITVDRSASVKVEGKNKVFEAQVLVGAAMNLNTTGQQWNVYNVANDLDNWKKWGYLAIGVDNGDLVEAVKSFREEMMTQCDQWLPAHTATEKAGAEKQTLEFAEFDSATYVMKDDGTVSSLVLDGVVSTLEFTGDARLADDSVGVLPFLDTDGKLQVRRLIESGNAIFKMTAPQAGEISDLTIFDQTWRADGDDNGPIHGIATVKFPYTDGPTKQTLNMCYKICIGDYEAGHEKCNDGVDRSLDCQKKTNRDDMMERAANEYLFP